MKDDREAEIMSSDMTARLEEIRREALEAIRAAEASPELEQLRIRFLGKKGELTAVLRGMGALDAAERPAVGQKANEVRDQLEEALKQAVSAMEEREMAARLAEEKLDVTMPGLRPRLGTLHPLTQIMDRMTEIFIGLGYEVAEGPEIESDYYNFEALNMPKDHPARDVQDTFYINDNILLRTQTSPVQIRVMEKTRPPIKIICPGRVYRADEVDATHSPIFHQIEGLVVDRGITMGDLIGTFQVFARCLFGEKTEIRLRPHHFQFTEPSAELDVTCWVCGGTGCRTCKGEGWIEILGAGMVHPRVLSNVGIDPEVYSGFAFGMGVDRTAMGRFGIDDLRLLFENDLRFLRQF